LPHTKPTIIGTYTGRPDGLRGDIVRFLDELRRQRALALANLASARRRDDDELANAASIRLADLEQLARRNGVRL
jgi:hypothetical protein